MKNTRVVFRRKTVREFHFWLAENFRREIYSKLFNFFFFFGEQERLLAENKWWTFFFFKNPLAVDAAQECERYYSFSLSVQDATVPPAASVPVNALWWQSPPSFSSSSSSPTVSLSCQIHRQFYGHNVPFLWCLIVSKNINITLVILLTHILQMGNHFL